MSDTRRRIARTLLQIIAGGGLATLVNQLALDLPATYVPYLMMASTAAVAIAQMMLEDWSGKDIGVARTGPHGG